MLFYVLAIIFGVMSIVLYKTAYMRSWGPPAVILCVLAAVCSVLLPVTGISRILEARDRRSRAREHLYQIGQQLSGELEPESRVLFLVPVSSTDLLARANSSEKEWNERLVGRTELTRQVLEDSVGFELEVVANLAFEQPADDYPVGEFNTLLDQYENEQVDLIYSLAGLPIYNPDGPQYELEDLSIFDWSDPPMFVAETDSDYDAAALRDYLADGLLSAIAVPSDEPDEPKRVYTPDNADELR